MANFTRRKIVQFISSISAWFFLPKKTHAKPTYNISFWKSPNLGSELRTTQSFAQVGARVDSATELRTTQSFAQVGTRVDTATELRTTQSFVQVLVKP